MTVEAPTLDRLFNPRMVAVLGASADARSISGKPLRFLVSHGYEGRLAAVNPAHRTIGAVACYPDVDSLPETPDVAVVALGANKVPEAIRQCGARGVSFAIVLASGFAEAGAEGAALQQQIVAAARTFGMRLVGPNSNGLLSLPSKLFAGFPSIFNLPRFRRGSVTLISQSGGLGFGLFGLADAQGVGFRHVVSVGNEADLGLLDFLEYAIDDRGTEVIVLYMEGLRDARRFRRAAIRALAEGKPLLVLKAATTDVGRRAAAAHTANLGARGALYDGLFAECGVVRVTDLDEIVDFIAVFGHGKVPDGGRVAVLTTTAGSGVVAADACARGGLSLPTLSAKTSEALRNTLPSFASVLNPIDLTADVQTRPTLMRDALNVVAADSGIDSLLVINGSRDGDAGRDTASALVMAARSTAKPLVVCWFARDELAGDAYRVLAQERIPRYPTPARASRALAALTRYHASRRSIAGGPGDDPDARLPAASRGLVPGAPLAEYQAKRILGEWGIPVTREALVRTPDEAVQAAVRIGFPVVLKIASPDIPHKTEVGGVELGLRDAAGVSRAFADLLRRAADSAPTARIDGVLVQEMVEGGVEVIVGALCDDVFGATVMFGTGGTLVEVVDDVAFRLAPVTRDAAEELIRSTRAAQLLDGVRGSTARDMDALVDLVVAVGRFAAAHETVLASVDLNPVAVGPAGAGARVLDALVTLRAPDA